jgi:hypothetical protein
MAYLAPITDEKMTYDYEKHMYILNKDFIRSRYKVDGEISDELLFDVSDNVYLFIYSFKTGKQNYDKMEYELAKNTELREWLYEALLRQFQYADVTNGDTIQLQHGIDLSNEKSLDIKQLRNELFISYKTYLILYIHGFLESNFVDNTFDYTNYRRDY